MEPTGIRLIRQILAERLPQGWTVAQARMDYVHANDVEWQVLTFHVIDPQGKQHELKSDQVPARDDINELVIKTAKKFAEDLKDGPHAGINPQDGGE